MCGTSFINHPGSGLSMATIHVDHVYTASKTAVWDIFADIGNVKDISPGVVDSKRENKKQGVGGRRSCDFGKGAGILEEVTAWKKGTQLQLTGVDFWGAPMKKMVATFDFTEADGQTTVTCNMDFGMKMGWLLNPIAKGQMRKAMKGMLEGADAKLAATPPVTPRKRVVA